MDSVVDIATPNTYLFDHIIECRAGKLIKINANNEMVGK